MKRFSFIGLLILAVISCTKFPYDWPQTMAISSSFDWKTFEAKTVTYNSGPFSVVNQNNDTIAYDLPAGSYDLNVTKGSTLVIIPSQNVETKDFSSQSTGTKSRVYFPAKNKYSTVMFEDLFPFAGDEDMNDLVFGLNIEYDLNSKAQVLAVHFNIQPRAIGSTKSNIGLAANFTGYTVEVSKITRSSSTLPSVATDFSDLTPIYSIDPKNGYYNPVNPNDAANADYRVAPFTGNFRRFFNTTSQFINVSNTLTPVDGYDLSLEVVLNSTAIPYNKFTFLSGYDANKVNVSLFATFESRSREVHFKNQQATKYFDLSLFNTANTDFTCTTSEGNWVWAILASESVHHPLENNKITSAYANFATWVSTQNFDTWFGTYDASKVFTAKNFGYYN